MNSKLMCAIAFSMGAAVGAAVSWRILEPAYERLAKEQIDSVKEYYSRDKEVDEDIPEEDPDTTYEKMVGSYNTETVVREKKEEDHEDRPYVISPEEFAEIEDYETTSLYYFSDEVLTYLSGEVVEDVDEIVGTESLTHFGEYEDDSVFVRNDRLKTDYEILRDPTRYADGEKFDVANGVEE